MSGSLASLFDNYWNEGLLKFSREELLSFQQISEFMSSNPRKIKKITNIYRYSRLLYGKDETEIFERGESKHFLRKLLIWIVLLEQWPVRMAWILHILEVDEHSGRFQIQDGAKLYDIFENSAKKLVYQVPDNLPLAQQYMKLMILDKDPQDFEHLLKFSDFTLSDVGRWTFRTRNQLLNYLCSMNPAIRFLISSIASFKENGNSSQAPNKAPSVANQIPLLQIGVAKGSKNHANEHHQIPIDATFSSVSKSSIHSTSSELSPVIIAPLYSARKQDQLAHSSPDDRYGRDHAGYLSYSMALAMFVHSGVKTPCIVGLYAHWGAGKSFLMTKIMSSLKLLLLQEQIVREPADFKYLMDTLQKYLETDENQLDIIYKWFTLGCPLAAFEDKRLLKLSSGKVNTLWNNRFYPFYWQEEMFKWRFFKRGLRLFRRVKISDPLLSHLWEHRHTRWEEKDSTLFDYEFVWFNAWLFSGTDTLWAGLIKELFLATERHFGNDYANAQEKAAFYIAFSQGLIALLLFLLTYYLFLFNLGDIEGSIDRAFAPLLSAFACITTGTSAVFTHLNKAGSASNQIIKDVASPGFKDKLGFMAIVKAKLDDICDLLCNRKRVPCMWDFIIPIWFGAWRDPIRIFCEFVFGGRVKLLSKRPCRIVIFVDDLDRCEAHKAVEVLRSLVLLAEGTPFVVFLSVDPRSIVTAIEGINDLQFSNVGSSGFEFLDKIVQIPFAIPPLRSDEKAALCSGLLLHNKNFEMVLEEQTAGYENFAFSRMRGRKFSLYSNEKLLLTESVVLKKDGSIDGSNQLDMRHWRLKSGVLEVLNVRGFPSARYFMCSEYDGKLSLWGPYIGKGSSQHFLIEPCIDKEQIGGQSFSFYDNKGRKSAQFRLSPEISTDFVSGNKIDGHDSDEEWAWRVTGGVLEVLDRSGRVSTRYLVPAKNSDGKLSFWGPKNGRGDEQNFLVQPWLTAEKVSDKSFAFYGPNGLIASNLVLAADGLIEGYDGQTERAWQVTEDGLLELLDRRKQVSSRFIFSSEMDGKLSFWGPYYASGKMQRFLIEL